MHDPCLVLEGLDALAHAAIERAARIGKTPFPVFVDATAGNGHDTLFLASLLQKLATEVKKEESAGRQEQGLGKVYAFDTQAAALLATGERLAAAGLAESVALLHAGHERMAEFVPVPAASVTAIVFNLGFLPGSDKAVATRAETTLAGLAAATKLVAVHGLLSVHVYTGHAGGAEECEQVRSFFSALPRKTWRVQYTTDGNKVRNVEWLILAEKIGEEA